MQASLYAVLLSVLLTATWLLGRRRQRPFLSSTDTSAVAELNRAQIARLREPLNKGVAAESASLQVRDQAEDLSADIGLSGAALPLLQRQRRVWLRRLQAWLRGSREQRLRAIAMLGRCDHRDVLPLLRLGLRDPDPAVMAAAAAAMQRFRMHPPPAASHPVRGRAQAGSATRLSRPRSVSRTL